MMLAASLLAAGCAPSAPDIEVSDAWARATAPGQSSGAIYATIANRGSADRLVGVAASAGTAMLHSSATVNGVSRMRMLSDLAIPANGQVALAPGGTHIMLTGLPAPLATGADLRLTLRFAQSGSRTLPVAIVAPGSR